MGDDKIIDMTGWTNETLFKYITDIINSNDLRYEQRFQAQQLASQTAFEAQITAMNTAFISQKEAVNNAMIAADKAVSAALAAADRAVIKAEIAAEKRFDSVNEFRSLVSDQQRTLMPRVETELLIRTLNERITAGQHSCDDRMEALRQTIEKNYDSLAKVIAEARLRESKFLLIESYEIRQADLQRQVNENRAAVADKLSKSSGMQSGVSTMLVIAAVATSIIAVISSIILHFVK